MTLPELERIKSAERQIQQIGRRYPDAAELPGVLRQLSTFMTEVDPKRYKDFPDITVIHSIGQMVEGDKELVDKVSTAIVDIMADAQVHVKGVVYSKSGELVPEAYVKGKIVDIVPEVQVVPESVPMLKIEDYDENVYYVPFTKIKEMKI